MHWRSVRPEMVTTGTNRFPHFGQCVVRSMRFSTLWLIGSMVARDQITLLVFVETWWRSLLWRYPSVGLRGSMAQTNRGSFSKYAPPALPFKPVILPQSNRPTISSNEATWVLFHHDSSAAPQSVQTALPVCGTDGKRSSVELGIIPFLRTHLVFPASPRNVWRSTRRPVVR